jgi:hypothetical protein
MNDSGDNEMATLPELAEEVVAYGVSVMRTEKLQAR